MVDDLDDLGDFDIMQPPSEHTHWYRSSCGS